MDSGSGVITLSDADRCLVGSWAADVAERALPLFEAQAPADPRPRRAIAGMRAYAGGVLGKGPLRAAALAALAAAREVGDPAAAAAARAAGYAAAVPFTHALAAPQHAKHFLAPVVYAARALELAGGDPRLGNEEIARAIAHASPAVREVVTRWPGRDPGRTRLSLLFHQLDAGLRG